MADTPPDDVAPEEPGPDEAGIDTVEIQGEPERVWSSFVHGYTSLPVTVTRR